MDVIRGVRRDFKGSDFLRLAAYRHKVFVETLGWHLHSLEDIELDQFDRADTIYLTIKNAAGHLCGCARLLPTNLPYLLGEVFPELLNGQAIPSSPDIWELSRFAAVDFTSPTQSAYGQLSAPLTIKLLHETIDYAAQNGAKRLIAVTVIGAERLMRKAGFHVHRAGPPILIDGHPLVACWIEIT